VLFTDKYELLHGRQDGVGQYHQQKGTKKGCYDMIESQKWKGRQMKNGETDLKIEVKKLSKDGKESLKQ
jgi:hypothetical protein